MSTRARTAEATVVAVDLGGTWLRVAAFDDGGSMGSPVRVPTPSAGGPEAVVEALCELCQETAHGSQPKVVIGVPGPVDPRRGVVHGAPNLPGWKEVPLLELVRARLGWECRVEHDAGLAALGEHRRGAGRGSVNFAYVTVSTGIGAGLILDRRLYRGSQGTAGEFGHMVVEPGGPRCRCGNRGCLEAVASGTAIAQMGGRASGAEVSEAAAAGDLEARDVLDRAAGHLGRALGGLLNLLNLDAVALGGGVFNSGPRFWEQMVEAVAEGSFPGPRRHATLAPAELRGDAGLLGAFELAQDDWEPRRF